KVEIGKLGADIFRRQVSVSSRKVVPAIVVAQLSEQMMRLYLGIDAGATRTRAGLFSNNGEILGTGETGAANTPAGLPHALEIIGETYSRAIDQAGIAETAISSIHAGIGMA